MRLQVLIKELESQLAENEFSNWLLMTVLNRKTDKVLDKKQATRFKGLSEVESYLLLLLDCLDERDNRQAQETNQ